MLRMMRGVILLVILLLAFSAAGKDLQAQTAQEFESRGLSHFKKAYYDAVPKKNTTLGEIEYGLAEKAFRQAIQKRPDRIEAYLYLGRTYFVQKKYAQAVETYRAALKVDPQKKQVYLKMASAQEMGGDYAGAIDSLMRLRDQETDERVLKILDEFIQKLETKAQSRAPDLVTR
jgi:cytochrome c-type biogenesis protein CcmH/NrfG